MFVFRYFLDFSWFSLTSDCRFGLYTSNCVGSTSGTIGNGPNVIGNNRLPKFKNSCTNKSLGLYPYISLHILIYPYTLYILIYNMFFLFYFKGIYRDHQTLCFTRVWRFPDLWAARRRFRGVSLGVSLFIQTMYISPYIQSVSFI